MSPGVQILSVVPWKASGPGWSNSGLTVRFKHPMGEEWEETIYREQLRGDAAALFPHLLAIYQDMALEVRSGRSTRRGLGTREAGPGSSGTIRACAPEVQDIAPSLVPSPLNSQQEVKDVR
jgi:hypothetical protein